MQQGHSYLKEVPIDCVDGIDFGNKTLVRAVDNVGTYSFLTVSDIICHLENTGKDIFCSFKVMSYMEVFLQKVREFLYSSP